MSGRLLIHLATLALGLFLLTIVVATAAAHAELRWATPEPGSVLDTSPDEIRLTFNEPLRVASTFAVYNRAFKQMPGIEPKVLPEEEEQLAADVPPLAADVYTVQWNVVGIDGHPSSGSYSFEVSAADSPGRLATLVFLVLAGSAVVAALALFIRRRTIRKH